MPGLPGPLPKNAPGCDYQGPLGGGGPIYLAPALPGSNEELRYVCRCIVCARCGHHTGNNTQGHFWSYCKVTRTVRTHHMCCPDDCELEAANAPSP